MSGLPLQGRPGGEDGDRGPPAGEQGHPRHASVREIPVGTTAISPATFPDLETASDFAELADEVRTITGGIPVGFKLSAQHIEDDLDFALGVGVDYIILDGRGGGTGSAPLIFRDNISVPTLPALARARRHLDQCGRGRRSSSPVTLIVTDGLRTPADFAKAMMLGADGVAVSNAARIVGEFEDSALLKVFGQRGAGVFPAPAIIQNAVSRQYRVRAIATVEEVREQFYAISLERTVKNPIVAEICDMAREKLAAIE